MSVWHDQIRASLRGGAENWEELIDVVWARAMIPSTGDRLLRRLGILSAMASDNSGVAQQVCDLPRKKAIYKYLPVNCSEENIDRSLFE